MCYNQAKGRDRHGAGTQLYCPHQRSENERLSRLRHDRRGGMSHFQPRDDAAAEILHRHSASEPAVHHADVHRRADLGRDQRSDHGPHRGHGKARKIRPISSMGAVCGAPARGVRRADVRASARHGRAGKHGLHLRVRDGDLCALRHGLHDAADPLRVAGLRRDDG